MPNEERPSELTEENVEEFDYDEETGVEATEYPFHQEDHGEPPIYFGKIEAAKETDVTAEWIDRANSKLPIDYNLHIVRGEFKAAAEEVLHFKKKWFQNGDNLTRREKVYESFLTALHSILEIDYFYYALEFTKMTNKLLGPKNKNIIRQKYVEIQMTLTAATRESAKLMKVKETRRSQSMEYPWIAPNTPENTMYQTLRDYVDCRVKMIDLYLITFQSYERYADWNDFLLKISDCEKYFYGHDIPPILLPAVNYFKQELTILKNLILCHIGIAQMQDTMMNLIELTKIRSSIMNWAKEFEISETSGHIPIIGQLQKTELDPKFHTALWFLKFYDFLTAKISLYITDHLSSFMSPADLEAMHGQDNMYNFISLFKTFLSSSKPILVAVVMDRSSFLNESFYGFNRPNQHRKFKEEEKTNPFEGAMASHPFVFRADLVNPENPRSASGNETCHLDIVDTITEAKENFAKIPTSAMNPKPHPPYEKFSKRYYERVLYCDHIEENLFVVVIFHGTNSTAEATFTKFVRDLLPVLTGKALFAEMKKLLAP